ncbi:MULTISPECIES: hypothetical protein [unclassified Kaistella]|uniref:hypothetical protein n=1 Tax=unclassified Kaistella TaxID=2762626 RepID=UPI002735810C|nr:MULTISPECIES: hypothetical protein [unclassified Kaistella]MDP2452905.1 hypothetical protein [Kaistella sp. SH11-4b]MDP2455814.1 hypothetical protein [Kaistella sp. SH40-3]MDP2458718.1 hypothetical protein [Kaistella sp. SH19-2b]
MTITVNPKNKKESEKIKAILKAIEVDFVEDNVEKDWWNELSDAEKKSIETGLKDIEEGRVISHEEVMKSFGR